MRSQKEQEKARERDFKAVVTTAVSMGHSIRNCPTELTQSSNQTKGGKEQGTGIRQGCTLSPFMFTLILSAIMEDVEAKVRDKHPMATTPVMTVMDLEYADDTALLARSAEVANRLLQATEATQGV